MSAQDRPRKPKLDRTQPIRNWSTLFEAPGSDGAKANPGSAARGGPDVSFNDVVARSVDVGYRVVDEYIRRGQRVAQRISERTYDVPAMTSDFQELAARTVEYASDFAAVWLGLIQRAATESALLKPMAGAESLRATASAAGASNPSARPRDGQPSAATSQSQPARVKIEVAASQPTEVMLDLRPEATGLRLIVNALRAVDPEKPRLTEVGFRPAADGEAPSVWIRVPPGQPAGVYHAVIIDEQSNRPVGMLSVRIPPA